MGILVTGAGGQVGRELGRLAPPAPLTALTRAALDITDAPAVRAALARHRARLVINAAAWTDVDRAEREPAAAFAVNRDGAAILAAACHDAGIPLLHLSTDQVFGGQLDRPWRENDPALPLSVYGWSKQAGEEAVRRLLPQHLILRVSWVFGAHGRNFVRTLLNIAEQHDVVPVVGDQTGGPTPAAALAQALLALAGRHLAGEALPWGTYHYCGQPYVSRAAFATAVFAAAGEQGLLRQLPRVQAITSAEWPGAGLRPANACLDCSAARQQLGLLPPDWRAGLADVLAEIRPDARPVP